VEPHLTSQPALRTWSGVRLASPTVVADEHEMTDEENGRKDEEPNEAVNGEADDAQDDVQNQGAEEERKHFGLVPRFLGLKHRFSTNTQAS